MVQSDVYTVSEITFAVKKNLESSFQRIQVKGEITNLRKQSSGHIYFSLKDANAQISAVLFQNYAKNLSRPIKDGDLVVLEGDVSVYTPKGTYQIIARSLSFDGVGNLLMELYRLKEDLQAKGFFDPARKKPLPLFPKTIGVVTSPSGSVIQDILHILNRRFSGFHLILYPVKVQGEGAASEIAAAIDGFNQHKLVDVIIVCRGGGSLEDLWPFNEKIVAEAIYRSDIPIISAVGHETDFSISDFVADVRAPTPSAAAELVLQEKKNLQTTLFTIQRHLQSTLEGILKQHRYRIQRFQSHPKMVDPYSLIGIFEQRLDDIKEELTSTFFNKLEKLQILLSHKRSILQNLMPIRQIEKEKMQITLIQKALHSRIQALLQEKTTRMKHLVSHLESVNPKNVLKKGYCICFEENTNSVIISAKELLQAKEASLLMHDGVVKVAVSETKVSTR